MGISSHMCTKQSSIAAVEESRVQTSLGPMHAGRSTLPSLFGKSCLHLVQSAHVPAWAISKHESVPALPFETHSHEVGKNLGQVFMGSAIEEQNSVLFHLHLQKQLLWLFFFFFLFQEQFRCIKNKFYKNRRVCLNVSQLLRAEVLFTWGGLCVTTRTGQVRSQHCK